MSHQIYIRDDLKRQVPDSRLGGHCLSVPRIQEKIAGVVLSPSPNNHLLVRKRGREFTGVLFLCVCVLNACNEHMVRFMWSDL